MNIKFKNCPEHNLEPLLYTAAKPDCISLACEKSHEWSDEHNGFLPGCNNYIEFEAFQGVGIDSVAVLWNDMIEKKATT